MTYNDTGCQIWAIPSLRELSQKLLRTAFLFTPSSNADRLLTDCECMIFFTAPDCADINLALNKPANQPSTFIHDTAGAFVATRAVDGDQTTVSCTRGHVHPWWSVDLGEPYNVGRVTVTHDSNEQQGNYPRTVSSTNRLAMHVYWINSKAQIPLGPISP